MPSGLVFTAAAGGVYATGTFDTDITGILLPSGDYQLMQMDATYLWLKPLKGGYDIKKFRNADLAVPYADIDALRAALLALLAAAADGTAPVADQEVTIAADGQAATPSAEITVTGAHVIGFQFTVSDATGGDSEEVFFEGTIDGSTWIVASSTTVITENDSGTCFYSIYAGTHPPFKKIRCAMLRIGSTTATLAGRVLAVQ